MYAELSKKGKGRMKFIGREKELKAITSELRHGHASVLLYGRRRFGKTWLIREAMKSISGITILYTCKPMSLEDNAIALSSRVLDLLGLSPLSFTTFEQLFDFISKRPEKFTIALDEYQDLKQRNDSDYVDSIFRDIIDGLEDNVSILLAGSSLRLMRSLTDAANPLFERFTLELHLKEMNYLDSAGFYLPFNLKDRITLYSIFGGIPLLNSMINPAISAEENIINLFIDENGGAQNYVRGVISTEVRSIPDAYTILNAIGNGKKKYSEIESCLKDEKSRNQLSRTLEAMIRADLIRKRHPINRKDRKSTFYEIASNPLRFHYSYLTALEDNISISAEAWYKQHVAPSLSTYISYRFEEIARSWFSLLSEKGIREDILDIGTYWFDDRKNGEFDVAIKTAQAYEVYEVKFLKDKLSLRAMDKEIEKIKAIEGLGIGTIGFISASGFESSLPGIRQITGEELYSLA